MLLRLLDPEVAVMGFLWGGLFSDGREEYPYRIISERTTFRGRHLCSHKPSLIPIVQDRCSPKVL